MLGRIFARQNCIPIADFACTLDSIGLLGVVGPFRILEFFPHIFELIIEPEGINGVVEVVLPFIEILGDHLTKNGSEFQMSSHLSAGRGAGESGR